MSTPPLPRGVELHRDGSVAFVRDVFGWKTVSGLYLTTYQEESLGGPPYVTRWEHTSLGARLRWARVRKEYTLMDTCERLARAGDRLDLVTLSDFERNHQVPAPSTLGRLAGVHGVRRGWLESGEGQP